jgi:Phage portal protein
MSVGSRIKDAWRALTRTGGPAGYGMGTAWSGGPLYADAFGAKLGPAPWQLIEAYKQIAFACTEFNALGVSALPLRLYAASGAGKSKPRPPSGPRSVKRSEIERLVKLPYVRRDFSVKEVEDVHEITEHPLLDALDHPAMDPETGLEYFDRTTLIATLCRYLDIVGIAYLKPENEAGVGFANLVTAKVVPPLLWPLQSQYVWPVRRPDSALIAHFKYFTKEYLPEDLLFIRLRASLRDPYGAGYAAAQAAWQYAGLEDKGISMWDQLLGTGARPNLIASPEDPNAPPGDDERRRFQAEMNTYHAAGRAGRFLATNGGWKFTPIQYPGFDTGEMEVNVYNLERMANCFGCPISFLTRETNLANFQAGRTFHAQFGIEPRAQCLASSFTSVARKYDQRLFFAFDGAIGEDREQTAKIIDMKVKAGLVTGNEANSEEPWDPKPWLDEPWIPNSLVQPSMAVEKHEQGLETAKQLANQPKPGQGPAAGPPKKEDKAERALLRRAEKLLGRLEREIDR